MNNKHINGNFFYLDKLLFNNNSKVFQEFKSYFRWLLKILTSLYKIYKISTSLFFQFSFRIEKNTSLDYWKCSRRMFIYSRSSSSITIQTIIHRTILNGMEIYETRQSSHRAKFTMLERNERKRDKLHAWQLVNSKQLSRDARYSIPCYALVSQIAAVSTALPLTPLSLSLFFFLFIKNLG